MALLRCPKCNAKGEVIVDDPLRRVRCSACGHSFEAGDADSTHEYNILSDDASLFLSDAADEPAEWIMPPRWQDWVERLAAHCGLDAHESVRQALAEFAKAQRFAEPPPRE